MPPRRKLSDLDRGRAIGWLQDGVAVKQVALRLAVAPSVIIRLTEIPRNWKSAVATTFWSAQSHHTKIGSLHSEAGHATKNGYGKQH
ncbi:hypothetical protein V1264_017105 [Littorina saxatilis]|uniref:Uncharacterized protein n=1 Tax=Littorina saxatilis TaxID=31220 RepID=A0AAN9GGD7_9CAEN